MLQTAYRRRNIVLAKITGRSVRFRPPQRLIGNRGQFAVALFLAGLMKEIFAEFGLDEDSQSTCQGQESIDGPNHAADGTWISSAFEGLPARRSFFANSVDPNDPPGVASASSRMLPLRSLSSTKNRPVG